MKKIYSTPEVVCTDMEMTGRYLAAVSASGLDGTGIGGGTDEGGVTDADINEDHGWND